jgi:hypothetical protein
MHMPRYWCFLEVRRLKLVVKGRPIKRCGVAFAAITEGLSGVWAPSIESQRGLHRLSFSASIGRDGIHQPTIHKS